MKKLTLLTLCAVCTALFGDEISAQNLHKNLQIPQKFETLVQNLPQNSQNSSEFISQNAQETQISSKFTAHEPQNPHQNPQTTSANGEKTAQIPENSNYQNSQTPQTPENSSSQTLENTTATYELDETTIEASSFIYHNGVQITHDSINRRATGNGDITSALKALPNVRFDSAQLNSNSPGEIDPANISISGGLYYQNAFVLDGMSINSDLTGGAGMSTVGGEYNEDYTPAEQRGFKGRSQALNIDTSLLESISVQDSNIGAAYGGFTGGVIEARTKHAERDFGANISYQISQGNAYEGATSLTRYHIYGDRQAFLNSTQGINQPKFVKHSFRSSFESKITDKFGLLASFTALQSFIPRKDPQGLNDGGEVIYGEKQESRQSYNFFVKAHYQASPSVFLEASYAFMPQNNRYFDSTAKDSDTTIKTGGHQVGFKALIDNTLGFLSATANANFFEETRKSKSAVQKQWAYSASKSWGNALGESWEGGLGDEDMRQNEVELKISQNLEALGSGAVQNFISFGGELGYTRAYFHRLKDSSVALGALADTLTSDTCIDEFCYYNADTGENQYFMMLNRYKAGKFALGSTTAALFVEDELKFDFKKAGQLIARLGLRLDYDTYMQKAPIAPRFALTYVSPEWSALAGGTSVSLGANRYYGRSLFAYRFSDGLSALEENYMRLDASTPFDENALLARGENNTNFKRLKIPYDDEFVVGLSQELKFVSVSAKYIRRFGREQVRRVCMLDSTGVCPAVPVYTYDNSGESTSDIFTFAIDTKALKFRALSNSFSLAYDYTNTKRAFNSYTESHDPAANSEYALYKGELTRLSQLNVSNFARPHIVRLTTSHQLAFRKANLSLNNFFRYRSAYKTTIENGGTGSRDTPYIIEDTRIKPAFTWDMRLGLDFRVDTLLARDLEAGRLYVNIDIINLLNSANLTIYRNSKRSPQLAYELGRQFWLQVGYKY